jgi:hypothetical protein
MVKEPGLLNGLKYNGKEPGRKQLTGEYGQKYGLLNGLK